MYIHSEVSFYYNFGLWIPQFALRQVSLWKGKWFVEGQTNDRRTNISDLFIPYDNKNLPVELAVPFSKWNGDFWQTSVYEKYFLYKTFIKLYYWNIESGKIKSGK